MKTVKQYVFADFNAFAFIFAFAGLGHSAMLAQHDDIQTLQSFFVVTETLAHNPLQPVTV